MKECIWKVQNSFDAADAVKTPLKDQWIFCYSKRNSKDKRNDLKKDAAEESGKSSPAEKTAELQAEPQEDNN
jgi:hypothetical protein